MHIFPIFSLLTVFVIADFYVWRRIDRLLRQIRLATLWRVLWVVALAPSVLFTTATILLFYQTAKFHQHIPAWLGAYVYIWNFLILPPTFLVILFRYGAKRTARVFRIVRARFQHRRAAAPSPEGRDLPLLSRRGFLTLSAAVIPPLATGSLVGVCLEQRGKFRINRQHLAVADLPPQLDGLTIAHVADIHTGIFTTQKMLDDIVYATNNLRADLILLGGDLINLTHSDLPNALDMVQRLDCPLGIFMVQGNHDLVQPYPNFDLAVRARGIPLLVDDVTMLSARGVPFQLLGTRWTADENEIKESVASVAVMRDPAIFSMLLTHHPHGWDEAARRDIPLVLAGHTHGGQLMLTKTIGAGPLRGFRYWSGLYEKPNSKLFVSNGVGNWFPLRINAPAEIVHLTLHPPASAT